MFFPLTLPNIHKKITRKNFKQKSFNKIYYQIKYGIKHNQKETNKLNAQREQNKEELNHMLIASKEIDNFIQNKNINNKIDMFKTDYAKQMYGYYDNETNKVKMYANFYLQQELYKYFNNSEHVIKTTQII